MARLGSSRDALVPSVWEDGDVDSLHMAVTAFDKPVLRALEKQVRTWGFKGAQIGSWGSGDRGGITVYVGDEEFRFELTEVAMAKNGRRIQYAPGTRYSVHGVLAGAYLGDQGARDSQRALTHAVVEGDTSKTLCRRIDAGRLCDLDEGPEPTCPICAERLSRLRLAYDPEGGFGG